MVEFIYKDATYRVRVRKEVILAAGAINTPQVLLLSGIGPKKELEKVGIAQVHNLPGVGQNLQNHVAFYMGYKLQNRPATSDLDWATALDYILYQNGPMSSTGLSQVRVAHNCTHIKEFYLFRSLPGSVPHTPIQKATIQTCRFSSLGTRQTVLPDPSATLRIQIIPWPKRALPSPRLLCTRKAKGESEFVQTQVLG